jgi:hypothetical protein
MYQFLSLRKTYITEIDREIVPSTEATCAVLAACYGIWAVAAGSGVR